MAYDGVGKDTFDSSLKSAGFGASVVAFGNASGKVHVGEAIIPGCMRVVASWCDIVAGMYHAIGVTKLPVV